MGPRFHFVQNLQFILAGALDQSGCSFDRFLSVVLSFCIVAVLFIYTFDRFLQNPHRWLNARTFRTAE